MNKILIAATLAALVATPALAKQGHVQKRTNHVTQGYAWVQPQQSVRNAQARYFVTPDGFGQLDKQLGQNYDQRP